MPETDKRLRYLAVCLPAAAEWPIRFPGISPRSCHRVYTGLGHRRADGVGPDALGTILTGNRLRQADDATLGRSVVSPAHQAHAALGRYRSHVDDVAALVGNKMFD